MRFRIVIFIAFLILIVAFLMYIVVSEHKDEEDMVQKRGEIETFSSVVKIGEVELQIEIARTPEEQGRGLSRRESLDENAGMLFMYENPTLPGFWMKDMKFPIDIIWIGADRKIADISENVAPETFPQLFHSRSPVQYVLEVNAGWAKAHNVSIGDEVILSIGE